MNNSELKGSQNQFVNGIAKWVYKWQQEKQCIVEIVYVNTKDNLSDAPSRALDIADEIKISQKFQQKVEKDFSLVRTTNLKGKWEVTNNFI